MHKLDQINQNIQTTSNSFIGIPGYQGGRGENGTIGQSGRNGFDGIDGRKGERGDFGYFGAVGEKGEPSFSGNLLVLSTYNSTLLINESNSMYQLIFLYLINYELY